MELSPARNRAHELQGWRWRTTYLLFTAFLGPGGRSYDSSYLHVGKDGGCAATAGILSSANE
ncbi:hypothetical protein I7I50_05104 [Histoplasma capsulatum G186AR]|uniref:Uncharacterized protein n=1 Tax=Ajellomyces capsulatus TaxID=5037 RepID=A0A8H7ZAQ5_AJECA|nr:hypothetical protein I7I52_03362 [Histoplasma capsulatum]QSS75831.1 hypothetical protein I7I50_05104 [Histoplasma capsulatum G186AR]